MSGGGDDKLFSDGYLKFEHIVEFWSNWMITFVVPAAGITALWINRMAFKNALGKVRSGGAKRGDVAWKFTRDRIREARDDPDMKNILAAQQAAAYWRDDHHHDTAQYDRLHELLESAKRSVASSENVNDLHAKLDSARTLDFAEDVFNKMNTRDRKVEREEVVELEAKKPQRTGTGLSAHSGKNSMISNISHHLGHIPGLQKRAETLAGHEKAGGSNTAGWDRASSMEEGADNSKGKGRADKHILPSHPFKKPPGRSALGKTAEDEKED